MRDSQTHELNWLFVLRDITPQQHIYPSTQALPKIKHVFNINIYHGYHHNVCRSTYIDSPVQQSPSSTNVKGLSVCENTIWLAKLKRTQVSERGARVWTATPRGHREKRTPAVKLMVVYDSLLEQTLVFQLSISFMHISIIDW